MTLLQSRAAAGAALLALLAGAVHAPVAAAQTVAVKEAWLRAPAPGQSVAGGYMELTSRSHALLIAVASPVAARGELHTMTMDGGVMRMRQVESIELPAGKPVKLAPGGLHLMLIDLRQALKPGDTVPLTLTVQRDGNRSVFTVQATVRPAAPTSHNH